MRNGNEKKWIVMEMPLSFIFIISSVNIIHIIVIIIVVFTRSWAIIHICQMTFILYELDSEEIRQEVD